MRMSCHHTKIPATACLHVPSCQQAASMPVLVCHLWQICGFVGTVLSAFDVACT